MINNTKEEQIKKIAWQPEYGEGLYPFCPYCNEPAYEEDHCVFCNKAYKWEDSPIKDTVVRVDNITIAQTSGNGIYIHSEKGLIAHMSCTKRMTEEELRELAKKEGIA